MDRALQPTVASTRSAGACFALALAIVLMATLNAKGAPTKPKGAKAAEQWVLQHLQDYGEADLDKSGLADKTLDSEFLEDLITSTQPGGKIPGLGIMISHAAIAGEFNVSNATIKFPLGFSDCTFNDGLDLGYDQLEHNFVFTRNTVGVKSTDPKNPPASASFIGFKVNGTADFDGSTFFGEADFTYAEFGSEFDANGVHFEAPTVVDFDTLKAKGPMFFRDSHFAGGLDLEDSDLFLLVVSGPDDPKAPAETLSLTLDQAHLSHGLRIKDVTLSKFHAGSLDSGEQTDLEHVIPVGEVDLRHSHFQDLTIVGFEPWLARGSSQDFHLEGMSFDAVEIPLPQPEKEKESQAMQLLKLIDSSQHYSPQPYLELEKFLRNHGSPDDADTTYVHMRTKQTRQEYWAMQPFDWTLYLLVGFGKAPWHSVIPALLLVVIGACFFPRIAMDHDDDKCTDEWYNRVWYSLDLLSPIDLGVSKKWRPKDSRLRNYAQFHRVAGWILIPLIAATITGIIK